MPAIQSLKKQLRSIRSTQKLTKAMKTAATVKFSKVSAIYSQYAAYGEQCAGVYEQFGTGYLSAVRAADPEAPCAVVVMASNKALCGGFNSELLTFAVEELDKLENFRLFACGKKAIEFFRERKMPIEQEFVFSDVPAYEESAALIDRLIEQRLSGKISGVYVVYPSYGNMMTQTPVIRDLFPEPGDGDCDALLIPDRGTVVEKTVNTIFHAIIHKLVLETATGAQAATLMTMRSAYDTATDYCTQLEGQINRQRQSTVTADVLETAGEWSE